ncbi:MAG: hypothetical protein ABEJ60_04690 [Halodesulfurarchaeum sp.]
MGTLDIFASNGECKWEGDTADPPQSDRSSETVRTQLRQGLQVFHDRDRNEFHCLFKAVDGTEHQYIARYRSAEGGEVRTDALGAIAARCERLGWTLREEAAAYGLLRSVGAVEPAVPLSELTARIDSGEVPVRLGAPDAETAIGVYRSLVAVEEVGSVLVSRSGATEAMPTAAVVVIPYESDRPGVPLAEHGAGDASRPAVSEAEQAVADLLQAADRPAAVRARLAAALADRGIHVTVTDDRTGPRLIEAGLAGALGGGAGALLAVGLELTPLPLAAALVAGGFGSGALLGHWLGRRRRSPPKALDARVDRVATSVNRAVADEDGAYALLEDRLLGPYGFEVERIGTEE